MRSKSSVLKRGKIKLSDQHTPSLLHGIINDEMTQMQQGGLPIFKTMILYNEFKRQQNQMSRASTERIRAHKEQIQQASQSSVADARRSYSTSNNSKQIFGIIRQASFTSPQHLQTRRSGYALDRINHHNYNTEKSLSNTEELRANRERLKNATLQKLVHEQVTQLYQPRKPYFQGTQMTLKPITPILSSIDQDKLRYQEENTTDNKRSNVELKLSQLSQSVDGQWEELAEIYARPQCESIAYESPNHIEDTFSASKQLQKINIESPTQCIEIGQQNFQSFKTTITPQCGVEVHEFLKSHFQIKQSPCLTTSTKMYGEFDVQEGQKETIASSSQENPLVIRIDPDPVK